MTITTIEERQKLNDAINTITEAFGEDNPIPLFGDGFTKLLKYQVSIKQNKAVKQLRELVMVLDDVLVSDGPFILTTSTGTAEWSEEVSREKILEFHLEATMQEILEIIGDGEEEQ